MHLCKSEHLYTNLNGYDQSTMDFGREPILQLVKCIVITTTYLIVYVNLNLLDTRLMPATLALAGFDVKDLINLQMLSVFFFCVPYW